LVTTEFKSGGLREKHVEATWKGGNHLSIRSWTQGNQEKPVSRWPVAGPLLIMVRLIGNLGGGVFYYAVSSTNYINASGRTKMNSKGFERKLSWPNRGSILACAWRAEENRVKSQVSLWSGQCTNSQRFRYKPSSVRCKFRTNCSCGVCKTKDIVCKQVIGLHGSPLLCGVSRNVPSDCTELNVVAEGEIKGDFVVKSHYSPY
jgi:hypothetical protein